MGKVKQWSVEKKDQVEKMLINMWASLGMDIPSNFEDIVQYCYEDVCETADPENWHSGDVAIAFRRWIEDQHKVIRDITPSDDSKDYFKIVHKGYQKELEREEIQVHCGENANLFLIKTEEGFIVDVYNNDNNIDTMTIWEDDLTPSREKMINYIMENEFGNDRDRDYERNMAFLESLDDEELEERYDKVKFETDHQD